LYLHTVYDRMYGDFPAKNIVYTIYIVVCMVLANPSHTQVMCHDHQAV